METDVQGAGGAQRQRLAHVDFSLFFLGEVSRADIFGRFDVAPAVATRDFARYRTLAPDNIHFDGSSKACRATDNFRPLFEHSLDRAPSTLTLSKGFGDGLEDSASGLVPCEYPDPINRPAIEFLAAFTRAIAGRRVLSVSYVSSSSGATEREIVPLAQADNGQRWHVRAFGRRASSFRDFVLRRWSVCSESHSLRGPEYRLWLRNRSALDGVDSASIAPGYLPVDSGRG